MDVRCVGSGGGVSVGGACHVQVGGRDVERSRFVWGRAVNINSILRTGCDQRRSGWVPIWIRDWGSKTLVGSLGRLQHLNSRPATDILNPTDPSQERRLNDRPDNSRMPLLLFLSRKKLFERRCITLFKLESLADERVLGFKLYGSLGSLLVLCLAQKRGGE